MKMMHNGCRYTETINPPVNADGSQIQNGRRAAHYVEGHPSVAQNVAQFPFGVVYLNTRITSFKMSSAHFSLRLPTAELRFGEFRRYLGDMLRFVGDFVHVINTYLWTTRTSEN